MTQPPPDFPDIEQQQQQQQQTDHTQSFSSDMPTTTTSTREEIMELTWHGGPVMIHHRSSKVSTSIAGSSHAVIPTTQPEHATQILRSSEQHMFTQEDEMATWLQHNLDSSFDRDLFAELVYSAPPPPAPITAAVPPTPPISVISPQRSEMFPNFPHFAHLAHLGIGPRMIEPVVVTAVEKAATMVESNETPLLGKSSQTTGPDKMGSSAGGSVVLPSENPAGVAAERKGKAKESDHSQSEEIGSDSEAIETKKKGRSSVSKKRQRAAEVHNLSERKRRDRINERIRTIQELVPGCNKSDKASILDDAIEYLKSMQLQLQMISMGFWMIPNPMMFPGMQQYMPTFGMIQNPMMFPGMQQYMPTFGMGMGMAHMGMGLNRPILPYQTILQASAGQSPADTAETRFSAQALNPSRIQASDQAELMIRLLAGQSPSMQQPTPNFLNPYQQQFLALQQAAQVSSAQTQGPVQPSGHKPSSGKDTDNPENRQTGP